MHILAGEYKGRKLLSPPARGPTRPMTGRVKKSLFDTLAPHLAGAVVADLYCGTGTGGLEALSRGAKHCFFAERDRQVLARLRRNIDALGLERRCTIWRGDLTRRLAARLAEMDPEIDVALVDPPYADARRWSWETVATQIFTPLAGRLSPDGVVVLRVPAKLQTPETVGPLEIRRRKAYGDMALVFLAGGS